MKLHELISIVRRTKKRVGRGPGSGKGFHTTGRGQKGQKSRGKIPSWFEGGQLPLIRRTPFIKGKTRFGPLKSKPVIVTLTQLNRFPAGSTIDAETILKSYNISPKAVATCGMKLVATGRLDKALKVKLNMSASAKKAIETAKGSVLE